MTLFFIYIDVSTNVLAILDDDFDCGSEQDCKDRDDCHSVFFQEAFECLLVFKLIVGLIKPEVKINFV